MFGFSFLFLLPKSKLEMITRLFSFFFFLFFTFPLFSSSSFWISVSGAPHRQQVSLKKCFFHIILEKQPGTLFLDILLSSQKVASSWKPTESEELNNPNKLLNGGEKSRDVRSPGLPLLQTPTCPCLGTGIILTQLHRVLEPAGEAAPHIWQKHPECFVIPVSIRLEALFRAFPWHRLSAHRERLGFNTEQRQSEERTHNFHSLLHEFRNHFISLGVARKFKGNGQSSVSQKSTEDCYKPQHGQYFSPLLPLSTICFHDRNVDY